MRPVSFGWILLNGIIGGFFSASLIVLFAFLAYPTEPHATLIKTAEAVVVWGAYFGIPVGTVVFTLSGLLLRTRINLRQALPYLYVGTILGGYLGFVASSDFRIGIMCAVLGYLVALIGFVGQKRIRSINQR